MADVKDCCKQEDNLVAHSLRHPETGKLREDAIVRICAECGCRHFEFEVDPGRLGLFGSSVGG